MRGFDFDKALVALQNELHCFAYKLTADKDEAEDLLQETMLRTLDNKDKFDSGTNFKGWMYTIMRNAFINNCRTKKIRGNLYVLSEPKYHFLLRDDSFIFVDSTTCSRCAILSSGVASGTLASVRRCQDIWVTIQLLFKI